MGCNRLHKDTAGFSQIGGKRESESFYSDWAIQTHTMLVTLGSAHHFVLVYPQFIMIHWRTWSLSGLVEVTNMELKQRRLELTGTEMRTAKNSI